MGSLEFIHCGSLLRRPDPKAESGQISVPLAEWKVQFITWSSNVLCGFRLIIHNYDAVCESESEPELNNGSEREPSPRLNASLVVLIGIVGHKYLSFLFHSIAGRWEWNFQSQCKFQWVTVKFQSFNICLPSSLVDFLLKVCYGKWQCFKLTMKGEN